MPIFRKPRGTSAGGEFARTVHAEAAGLLDEPVTDRTAGYRHAAVVKLNEIAKLHSEEGALTVEHLRRDLTEASGTYGTLRACHRAVSWMHESEDRFQASLAGIYHLMSDEDRRTRTGVGSDERVELFERWRSHSVAGADMSRRLIVEVSAAVDAAVVESGVSDPDELAGIVERRIVERDGALRATVSALANEVDEFARPEFASGRQL